MNKVVINMIGGGFQHAYSSCGWERPKYVIWDKEEHKSNISIHIDSAIFDIPPDKSKLNIGWFCESPYFLRSYTDRLDSPDVKEFVLNNFKYVFSNDKKLVQKHKEIIYLIPHAYPWVEEKRIFPKSKLISIIASGKDIAPGHKLRHIIINELKGFIDVYGHGYRPIKSKNEGLNDYMFSFSIENIQADGYFTEKVTDCFSTGTLPIYWGDQTISDLFLEDGIIRFIDNFDIFTLTKELYISKLETIKENFNRAINLPLPEDHMFLNYLK